MVEPNLKNAAYHEAGHVIAHIETEEEFREVTIIPTKDSQGNIYAAGEVVPLSETIDYPNYSNLITICFAGPCAEAKWRHCDFFNCCSFSEHGDGYRAYELISEGYATKSLDTPDGKLPKSIRAASRPFKHRAECLVNKRWKLINIVAQTLFERKSLTIKEIGVIVEKFYE
ncbi:MAG: hypothetical protein QG591_2422 [Planctomycetota bacterium]|nr:hypothetical protein [Planctomycetota bacterium]MDQ1276406.1 hypothetical protein [Euryarchaeota archaeon]